MKGNKFKIPHYLLFIQEMFLLYIILFPFLSEEDPFIMFIHYIILVSLGMGIYHFVTLKFKSMNTATISIPFVIIIGIIFGLSPFISIVLAVVLFWRTIVCINSEIHVTSFHLLFTTLGVVLLYYLYHVHERELLFIFLFVQMILTLLQNYSYLLVKEVFSAREKKTYGFSFIVSVTILILVSFAIGSTLPFAKSILLFFFNAIAYIFGILAAPILFMLEKILPSMVEIKENNENSEFDLENMILKESNDSILFIILEYILIFLIVSIVLYLFYYLWKKLAIAINRKEETVVEEDEQFITVTQKMQTDRRQRNIFIPKNEVRKRYYRLEKNLTKLGYSRKKGETVEEWLSTVPIDTSLKNNIAMTYSKVRYGNLEIDDEEMELYKSAIKEAGKKVKQVKINKNNNMFKRDSIKIDC